VATGVASALVATQIRALGRLAKDWQTETEAADRAMETFILSEENHHADGAQANP
jgi:hypothetical protein